MTNITNGKGFNKKNLNALRTAMEDLLKEHGFEDLELSEIGTMKYSTDEVTMPISLKLKGAASRTEKDLMFALKAYKLNRTSKNTPGAELVTYKSSNRKYPFIYKLNGQMYKCDTSQAKYMFG